MNIELQLALLPNASKHRKVWRTRPRTFEKRLVDTEPEVVLLSNASKYRKIWRFRKERSEVTMNRYFSGIQSEIQVTFPTKQCVFDQ